MAKQQRTRSRKAIPQRKAKPRRKALDETVETRAPERMEELREGVSGIRASRGIDVDRVALAVGGVLIAGGLVAIIIGWYGAATTGLPFEQTPYLISGGMLGVALVFLGGFVYFGYWVTRLLRETREQSERASILLSRIAASVDGSPANGSGPAATLVATRNGTQFHRPDCVVVAGKSGLRNVTARTRGLEPCRICDPV